jgi:hypothetical protein
MISYFLDDQVFHRHELKLMAQSSSTLKGTNPRTKIDSSS